MYLCAVPACFRQTQGRPRPGRLCNAHQRRVDRDGPAADLVTAIGAMPRRGRVVRQPNPWAAVSPPCPWEGHPPERVYLWHPKPEDGLGRWICAPCGRRFGVGYAVSA